MDDKDILVLAKRIDNNKKNLIEINHKLRAIELSKQARKRNTGELNRYCPSCDEYYRYESYGGERCPFCDSHKVFHYNGRLRWN